MFGMCIHKLCVLFLHLGYFFSKKTSGLHPYNAPQEVQKVLQKRKWYFSAFLNLKVFPLYSKCTSYVDKRSSSLVNIWYWKYHEMIMFNRYLLTSGGGLSIWMNRINQLWTRCTYKKHIVPHFFAPLNMMSFLIESFIAHTCVNIQWAFNTCRQI